MKIGKLSFCEVQIPSQCDVCKRNRRSGNHQKCSQIRQQRYKEVACTHSAS